MERWFHRNPPKAAVPLKFDEALLVVSKNSKSKEIITQLNVSRGHFLELVNKAGSTVEEVTVVFTEYLSLLRGLVDAPLDTGGESKLRGLTIFKWTNSLGGKTLTVQPDAWFEIISVVMRMAMWHTNHAANIFAPEKNTKEEALEVRHSLKLAAGMFLSVKNHLLPKLSASPEKGVDTDTRVVEAYSQMSQAEAQEVTLLARALKLEDRALKLNHKPDVIIPLALETSSLFTMAADSLKTLDTKLFKKWTYYLHLKAAFNEAYAYCFFGEELLKQDKCGESIKVMQHSQALSEKAVNLCEHYAHTKKEMGIARPDGHPLFQKLVSKIRLMLDKSIRENGFIYYHKVPAELPAYEKKQEEVYGLVTPEDFTLPPHHALWTEESYNGFQVETRDTSNDTLLLEPAAAIINSEQKKPSKSVVEKLKRTLSLSKSPNKEPHSTSDPSEEGVAAVQQEKEKKSIPLKTIKVTVLAVDSAKNVPEGKDLKELKKNGMEQVIKIRRNFSAQQVKDEIIRAFGCSDYKILQCTSDGKFLTENDYLPSGDEVIEGITKKKFFLYIELSDTKEARDEGSERADEVVESLQDCKPCDSPVYSLSDSAAESDLNPTMKESKHCCDMVEDVEETRQILAEQDQAFDKSLETDRNMKINSSSEDDENDAVESSISNAPM